MKPHSAKEKAGQALADFKHEFGKLPKGVNYITLGLVNMGDYFINIVYEPGQYPKDLPVAYKGYRVYYEEGTFEAFSE